MKKFAQLIKTIDSTNKTNVKVAALTAYFQTAPDKDKLWTIAILSHRRPKRPVNTTLLREWATELSNIPLWLFEESYHIVGDLAETIALILPKNEASSSKSLATYISEIQTLRTLPEAEKKDYLHTNWMRLNYYERFVFNKIITGSFRIGVSQKLMTRALSKATNIEQDILAYKLMGNWTPDTTTFQKLILEENEEDYLSKPYPFYLAYAVEDNFQEELEDISEWSFEHKWDGIRAQVIIRNNEVFVWSRGEELVTDKYPEFQRFLKEIPNGTVLDGEILPFGNNTIGNFKDLQTRIGRKNITKALLKKTPVILTAYDLLEWKGKDIRKKPFVERRKLLDALINNCNCDKIGLYLSETMQFSSWEAAARERNLSREKRSEGLMLKKKNSPYLVGRKKGDWWKWKIDPFTIDGVLTYAMRGHGRRANLYTDYTFGLWDGDELVTFAKAYSGLTDAEFKKVDAWIKRNTLERFGPVRSVTPHHVFEIAFEGIAESKRHKSGVATRFPRIVRWRKDKPIEEANTLDDLKALIPK
ncbi:ATP-dependent DNA ligase [Marixanthomonas sp. SCSIO 43207]|uniref:ATP-dependent DNA ligase n=1 Tax=Marixanthomonas sp. SCSIO 43207 TaxID=2779360 RepID=UPI001CA7F91C|nr:ATP-dependent DNA ligase [Marixanthomonas sp. SCSIO 43207]UAB82100.1 ATP-dependent DNA ligase [Marixanthomonas sp. SCSIO 43207]